MAYDVKIYKNSSAPDYFNKSLSGETTVSCEFKSPIDVENPTIYISATDAYDKYNYCYIAEFGRFYFMKAVGGNSQTITFECTSDPLMSFKSQILGCPAVISRNPWHWDKYISDPKLPIESRTVSAVLPFSNTGAFDGSNNTYILTCLGAQ